MTDKELVFPRHFARGFARILASDNQDPLCSFLVQIKLLLQTFSVARPSSFIFSQCPDFLSYFLQLLLDFLTVWSGVEAVVVIIHITMSFLRRFYCGVGKCRDDGRE